jgi:hypothetical protein
MKQSVPGFPSELMSFTSWEAMSMAGLLKTGKMPKVNC